jgi:hypothetical protein
LLMGNSYFVGETAGKPVDIFRLRQATVKVPSPAQDEKLCGSHARLVPPEKQ